MKAFILLSILFISASCFSLEESIIRDIFDHWKLAHKKVYANANEDQYRFQVFLKNYIDILTMNAKEDSVQLALNHFADLSTEEFSMLYLGTFPSNRGGEIKVFDTTNVPASVDWRAEGAVTPVKNQGACGSCWAFSASGALEGLYFINNTKLLAFSEQNLVDCVVEDFGCGGGWPIDAMSYSAKHGINTETDYPYVAKREKCLFNATKAVVVNDGYYNVTQNNLEQMKAALATQPISIGIQANQIVFQFYKGGVIKKFCGDSIDHGVLAVGYNNVQGTEAFIVKNSWGEKWGNHGYVYISTDPTANNGKGVCGILSMAAAPYKN